MPLSPADVHNVAFSKPPIGKRGYNEDGTTNASLINTFGDGSTGLGAQSIGGGGGNAGTNLSFSLGSTTANKTGFGGLFMIGGDGASSGNGTTVDADVVARRPIRRAPGDPALPREGSAAGQVRCEETGLLPAQCAHCLELPVLRALPDDAVPARPRPPVPAPVVLGYRRPTALETLRLAARWLVRNIDLVRRDVEAVLAHDEITAAIDQAEGACGAPPLRLFVGPCDHPVGYGEPDEHGHRVPILCGEDLYARPDFQAVTCPRCETLHSDMAARWDRALTRVRLYPASAALIAQHIGALFGTVIDRKTINQWHHRRKIEPVDHDDDGAPRFRIGAVLDLARAGQRQAS